ncbi:MAG TPA: SpoIIE family protein phosphatase, partial [Turneriella sp.]|nr:SpoIIE family protein phosphatase [Turneriella sp.]
IEFKEISLSTVRSKVLFFISIMIATLFVANFMIYYNVSFSVLMRFSLFAIAIAAVMAFMLFSVILQALREIEQTAQGIREGKNTMLFPEALDAEFINVATGLNTATQTIRDYQHNLERKVEMRTAELTEANEALHQKDHLIQMELDFAAEIQKGIIPTKIEEWNGLKFFSYYLPMEKVSGDYFDVFPAHGNRLGVLMADVSGHGVPAALITTMAKVAFARAAQNTHSPVQTFREVNNQLLEIVTTQDYLTAFYLTIDDTHHFLFGNASHQHAKIARARSVSTEETTDTEESSISTIDSLDTDGLFVGAMHEANESYAEKEGRLYAGDRLFLYTDGLIEIRNKAGEELGNAQFDALLQKASSLPAEAVVPFVVDEVLKFAEGNPPNDDISMLMIEVNPEYSRFLERVARANRLIESNNSQEGVELLEEAIQIYPKNLPALKTAALVNFDLARIQKSERYLKMYLEINKQDAEIFYYLSSIAILRKNFMNAEKYAREAIHLRANYALAFNNLAIASLNVGKYVAARHAMEKALSLEPENSEIQKNAEHLEKYIEGQNFNS